MNRIEILEAPHNEGICLEITKIYPKTETMISGSNSK